MSFFRRVLLVLACGGLIAPLGLSVATADPSGPACRR